jgi:hypothetical protein
MRNLLNDPEHRLALWQADRARQDYAEILDELDFVKLQLSRLPTRRDLAKVALGITFATAALVILWAEAFWRL